VSSGGGGEDCSGAGKTPGVKVLVRESLVDPFVAIVGRVSWFDVFGCSGTGGMRGVVSESDCWGVSGVGSGDLGATVLVWKPIVGSAVDVSVGIASWFNALGCSGTGRGGLGVTPTSCWDISGWGGGVWSAVP